MMLLEALPIRVVALNVMLGHKETALKSPNVVGVGLHMCTGQAFNVQAHLAHPILEVPCVCHSLNLQGAAAGCLHVIGHPCAQIIRVLQAVR